MSGACQALNVARPGRLQSDNQYEVGRAGLTCAELNLNRLIKPFVIQPTYLTFACHVTQG